MKKPKPKDVDTYIARADAQAIRIAKAIREIVISSVPAVEENIKWGVPFYSYHGPLAGFAVYKKHVSFGFATGTLSMEDREYLEKKGYHTGSKTVQIGFEQNVPVSVLKKIIIAKAKANKTQAGK